jgi:hypothetical protein
LLGVTAFAHSAQAETERRPLPDYDGRKGGGQPARPRDALIWTGRVVLFPAYVVSEYVIRRPLGFLITEAERAEVPATLYNFFVFGPDRKAGIVPTAFLDFGFSPSVGLYAFWDDAGFEGHQLRLHGSTWGKDWLAGSATERFIFSERSSLTLRGALMRRPDYAFYGVGRDTRESALSRYGAETADARAVVRNRFWRSSSLEATFAYRGASFYEGDFRGQPTLEERVAEGVFTLPDGYRDGYRAFVARGVLTFDTREPEARSDSGGRLELLFERAANLRNSNAAGWTRYGATLGGFLDLADSGRVLSLSASTEFVEPMDERPVPFTELVTLGGAAKMPGFREGRLYGRSAAVATLRYSWPIWIWLDGSLQAAVGNVFGEHLEGFSISDSRFSGAIGFESRGSRDSIFQLLLGFGTETFDTGAQVNSIRFTVGSRNGF